VIKTLYYYLSRDLVRVGLPALAAFTLVMTVFAIIEPLRKQGLESKQVVALISYTLPVMLTLTLPIAALFAATIVYGRFSQDNELMASRASGIAATTLLAPAITIGLVVTVLTLVMNNVVSPEMWARLEKPAAGDMQRVFFRQMKLKNFMKHMGIHMLHADQVNPETNELFGVVYTNGSGGSIPDMAAAKATVKLNQSEDGNWYADIVPQDALGWLKSSRRIGKLGTQPVQFPIPMAAKEQPMGYTWERLWEVLADPTLNAEVRGDLRKVRELVCHDVFGREIADTINKGQPYDKLQSEEFLYELTAPSASVDAKGTAVLSGTGVSPVSSSTRPAHEDVAETRGRDAHATEAHGQDAHATATATATATDAKRVKLAIYDKKHKLLQTLTAQTARVEFGMTSIGQEPVIDVKLQGEVVDTLANSDLPPKRRDEWATGQLEIPPSLQQKADAITIEDVSTRADTLTHNPAILGELKSLREQNIATLVAKVKGEIHSRLAYGIGCLLMVMMGAMLGLIFRGGQLISAFLIAMIPAAIVIIAIMVGTQIQKRISIGPIAISGLDFHIPVGLLIIWSGVAAMVVANAAIYMHLRRR
jgi:lipopolysaccharide export LptBFGC system permease protein LptF